MREGFDRRTVLGALGAVGCGFRPAIARAEAYTRPYGPNAPWNVPAASVATHPQSALYAERLWSLGSATPGNVNLTFAGYTYPVYDVREATLEVTVSVKWRTALHGTKLPWNPAWKIPSGSDRQVILLDPPTGREWNLWQVSYKNGKLSCTNGNLVPGSYWTREVGFPPSRGCGIPYLAMLVRPQEVEAGEIRHALSMPVMNPDSQVYVAPATKLEGKSSAIVNGIPEGMRFVLDVSDAEIEAWIAALPSQLPTATRRSARVIARALRDYGWFVTDTSGGAHLQFEEWGSAGAAWQALGLGTIVANWKEYPRDLLDGLLRRDRIRTLVPSDQYPPELRARP
jgi:hypothetical protein